MSIPSLMAQATDFAPMFSLEGQSAPGDYALPDAVWPQEDTIAPIPDLWDTGLDLDSADPRDAESLQTAGHAADTTEPTADPATPFLDNEHEGEVGIAALTPPQLVAPLPNETVTPATAPPTGVPTLQWTRVEGAQQYRVQISASPGFAVTLVSQDTYALSFTPLASLPDGTYYWRVQAGSGRNTWGDFSEMWSFIKDWSNGQTLRPQLVAPDDNAAIFQFTHDHFTWEPIAGAAAYVLEIATDPSFNSPIAETTHRTHFTPRLRLANSTYYWRVAPLDAQGNRGLASEVRSFTFAWNRPPQLLAPNDAVETPFVPQFSWTPVESARHYQLEISTEEDLTNATVYVTANTDFTPEKALANDAEYFWRVKAIDANNVSSDYSPIRSFSMRWNFQPELLTPAKNAFMLSYPYFSWTPVPEAERYQIQIANNSAFERPIGNAEVFNVTAYTQPEWREAIMFRDYFWRVRAIDAQKNYSPWSDVFSFQLSVIAGPTLIYPHFYYPPDVENLPVHEDRTIAWPVFLWDSSHNHPMPDGKMAPERGAPDYYEVTVSETPDFSVINFQIETAGLAAAPTLEHPFTGLEDGTLYYWRVRAMLDGAPLGVDMDWTLRYDAAANTFPVQDPTWDLMQIMHPVAGKEAVEIAPVLGWLPVEDTHHYRIQVSRDRDFNEIVDEAHPQFVYYVPWQGRHEEIPFGTFWWRVRAEDAQGNAILPWSETRHFNVSQEAVMGNYFDFPVSVHEGILAHTPGYNPELTRLAVNLVEASEPDLALGAFHMMPDRSWGADGKRAAGNYTWIMAFEVAETISATVQYGIYIDSTHKESDPVLADPLGKPIQVDPLYRPDYVIYVDRTPENTLTATLYRRQGTVWQPGINIANMGGMVWLHPATNALHVHMPYTSLGSATDQFVGSLAVTVFSSRPGPATGMLASVPTQPGAIITRPAFISDMLMPLYPFDTALWNPYVHYEVPSLRWRMPYFNSVDGYEVQVALDDRFTQIIETWETFESGTSPFYALLATAFQSKIAYNNNESYFWRVRMRYEQHTSTRSDFERSSWSQPMRFKLHSYDVGNPQAGSAAGYFDYYEKFDAGFDADYENGENGEGMHLHTARALLGVANGITDTVIVQTTPTFTWERVEGAAGYRLWVSDDANFSKRIIDKQLDTVTYTPQVALPDATYYWMVAPRRERRVFGQWSPVMTFVKQSIAPTPISPIDDIVLNELPSFRWDRLYHDEPGIRLATPRYRLQIADDINFSKPHEVDTQATSYTYTYLSGNSGRRVKLTDGTWYWRVAAVDANGNLGAYSAVQKFRKEYPRPELISPPQGENAASAIVSQGDIPSFMWSPVPGAANYEIRIATTAQALDTMRRGVTTDNTRYTPTTNLANSANGAEISYFWRVQMFDADGVAGPTVDGWAVVPVADADKHLIFIPLVTEQTINP